ncbi:hypothetical protein BV210_19110 (plasmid) [Halorientalis sp. IM1011]|uniref:hypothetical protein n=1 Tax=Halorientalis sp. IM1011 TaxID=1932360 RepID=UPI00097CC0A8|nr:hypothetical protein [Halorientalis sp. IM1011]AQL44872.1 hypothetical protein BV210_19110 [Halorientalis sp. IM1011]
MTRRKPSFALVALPLVVALVLSVPVAAAPTDGERARWGCPGCSWQTDAPNGSDGNPLGFMTADASRESPTTFRVTVRDAGLAQSADAEPPTGVGQVDNGGLRGLSIQSNGGPSAFELRVEAVGSLDNFSTAARGEMAPPAGLDRPLLYVNATANAPGESFTVTYEFDAERDDLRDDDASVDDLRVLAFRDGRWRTLGNATRSPDGSDAVVRVTTSGTVPLAFGYPHRELVVTNLSQQGRLFANRTGSIRATVENRGHSAGREQFEIETRNDTILRNHTIFAAAGQRRTVDVPVRFPSPGEWPVEIDEGETTVRVERPRPAFVVSNLSLSSDRIAPGESVTVRATVRNDGQADGADVVRFRTFDTVVDAERLTLQRNATRQVTFSQRFDVAGTYRVGVGNRSRTVVVGSGGQPPVETTGERETPGDRPDGDVPVTVRWALVVIGAGAVLVFGLAALGRVVRRS